MQRYSLALLHPSYSVVTGEPSVAEERVQTLQYAVMSPTLFPDSGASLSSTGLAEVLEHAV